MIAGNLLGTRGAATTYTPVNVWDLQLNAGRSASLPVPAGHTLLLVIQAGNVQVNDAPLKSVELASFEPQGDSVNVRAETAARLLLLSGEPLNEPVVGQGPFVMNTREQIQQAIQDYRAGHMGRLT